MRLWTIGKYDFRYTLNSVTFEPDFQSTEVGLKVGYARKLFYRDRSWYASQILSHFTDDLI